MKKKQHICCDGDCNHDACCGKVEANCPNKHNFVSACCQKSVVESNGRWFCNGIDGCGNWCNLVPDNAQRTGDVGRLPEKESEEWREPTRQKLLKELDFLSDHWVNGDDKIPFSFGGWREEVSYNFINIIDSLLTTERKKVYEEVIEEGERLKKIEKSAEPQCEEERIDEQAFCAALRSLQDFCKKQLEE